MKTHVKKSGKSKEINDHPKIKGIFLTLLIILSMGSALFLFASLLSADCSNVATPITADLSACTPTYQSEPTSFIFAIILFILSLGSLLAWLKNKSVLSVNLAKLSLITLCLGVGTLWAIGISYFSSYADFMASLEGGPAWTAFLEMGISLTPFPLLYLVTRYRTQIIEGAELISHHRTLKTLFVLQLVVIAWTSLEPTAITLNYTYLWTIAAIISICAFIAFNFKKRALSVLLSQISLTALTLLSIWDLAYLFFLVYRQNGSFDVLLPIPLYAWPQILIPVAAPLLVLAIVTHYKKQIIEE